MTEQEIKRIFELLKDTELFKRVIRSLNRYEIFQLKCEIDGRYVNGTMNIKKIDSFIEWYMRSNNSVDEKLPRTIRNSIEQMAQAIDRLDRKRMYRLRNKAPIRLADNHFIQLERHIEFFNKKRREMELQRNVFFDFKIIKNSTNLDLNEKLYTCSLFLDVSKFTKGKVNIRDQYELRERFNIENFDFSRSEILQEMQNILGNYCVSQKYRDELAIEILQEEFPIEQTATTSSPEGILKELIIQLHGKNIAQQAAENLSKREVNEFIGSLKINGSGIFDPISEKRYVETRIKNIYTYKVVTMLNREISNILTPDIQRELMSYQEESETRRLKEREFRLVSKWGFVREDSIILRSDNFKEGFAFFSYLKLDYSGYCPRYTLFKDRVIEKNKPGYLMYFEKFLNEEGKYCIRLIPCQLLKLKNVSSFKDLENLFLVEQKNHPELYPTWKTLLSNNKLFNQSKNGQFAENEIIINCSKYISKLHNFISDDKELVELIVDKFRAMYTARNVMNDIYRHGGIINTLRPKPRFVVENVDLADDTNGSYIQSSKDPSRMIPMVDQMARDYKENRSLFERLWQQELFEEKQIVRNALCKEYKLDEKDKNNDIVIKFNEFNGEMTYNEGFALVNGKLIYFKKLQNDKLPCIFIECKSRKIVMIERQLEDFIKDCDGCLRLKNYHYYSTKENPKFTNYEDILCDGNYSKDLLSRPLTKAQLEKINPEIKSKKNKKQKTVIPFANSTQDTYYWADDSVRKYTLEDDKFENVDNVYANNMNHSLYGTYGDMGDDSMRKLTLEDDKRAHNSMWDSVFGDNVYTTISNIWDNFNGIDGNVYTNNMSIPDNNSSEKTKLKALQASTKEFNEKEKNEGENDSEISLD